MGMSWYLQTFVVYDTVCYFSAYCFHFQAPQRFKGASQLFKCELCRRHFESVSGAKGHTQEKKHKEKKNVSSFVCVCCRASWEII